MFGANCARILRQDWHYFQTDQNKLSLLHHQLGEPTGASKPIFEPMVRLAQTVHVSCTLTKLSPNGPSFHLSLVTKEYHRVRPKQFMSRWYVWRKLCTYLAPTLTLSPNEKK